MGRATSGCPLSVGVRQECAGHAHPGPPGTKHVHMCVPCPSPIVTNPFGLQKSGSGSGRCVSRAGGGASHLLFSPARSHAGLVQAYFKHPTWPQVLTGSTMGRHSSGTLVAWPEAARCTPLFGILFKWTGQRVFAVWVQLVFPVACRSHLVNPKGYQTGREPAFTNPVDPHPAPTPCQFTLREPCH